MKKRKWGYPVVVNTKGEVLEIKLYLYEQVELAKHNIEQCKKVRKQS